MLSAITGALFLNPNHLFIATSLLLASAGIAQASRDPTPPPSGIVIHLFGPNSVMSNVMPDLPGETAKPPAAAPGQTAGTASGGTAGAPTTAAQASGVETSAPSTATSNNPSWHDILHQLFVTGDPNAPNRLAPGRAAERQIVQ
jgi:hypothetical protein